MTPAEFRMHAEGYNKRTEFQMRMMAWHATNLMNCWVKRRVKIDDLLPRQKDAPPVFLDRESFRNFMRNRQREIDERKALAHGS